ncbi:hypothetical protein K461DRAFT_170440 [Myriangium duriaei CBS 260.36]|uniref:Uncharacterized protein n=1 Tax=Myriangium duriaei CBS 260.36 TaxID=1168546 RepID=A0A9P4IWM5_9PEZI|nr:hypothetical protein K461DRAFT_170440 [Myriangium duriaei CBS 260.36]
MSRGGDHPSIIPTTTKAMTQRPPGREPVYGHPRTSENHQRSGSHSLSRGTSPLPSPYYGTASPHYNLDSMTRTSSSSSCNTSHNPQMAQEMQQCCSPCPNCHPCGHKTSSPRAPPHFEPARKSPSPHLTSGHFSTPPMSPSGVPRASPPYDRSQSLPGDGGQEQTLPTIPGTISSRQIKGSSAISENGTTSSRSGLGTRKASAKPKKSGFGTNMSSAFRDLFHRQRVNYDVERIEDRHWTDE